MATLTNGEALNASITLTKQSGSLLRLSTSGKYVDKDVQFTIGVKSGAGAADTASADADVVSTDDSSIGGINISDVIGAKQITEPSSGYYIRVLASGSGNSRISDAGWMPAGALSAASATATKYFPVRAATVSVSGSNAVTPAASLTGSNVTLSNTNNGISITATGGGTATANATATGSLAGYIPAGTAIGSNTLSAPSSTTQATSYLSGVTLGKPVSGTNTFSITLPNGGNDTITLTFAVDANGNWSVE